MPQKPHSAKACGPARQRLVRPRRSAKRHPRCPISISSTARAISSAPTTACRRSPTGTASRSAPSMAIPPCCGSSPTSCTRRMARRTWRSSSTNRRRPSATRCTISTRRTARRRPEDLVPQFPMIRDATRAFSLPCIEEEGWEADDLIASYTKAALAQGWQVTIVSSDKDLMQLMTDPSVDMLDTMNNRRLAPMRWWRSSASARKARRRARADGRQRRQRARRPRRRPEDRRQADPGTWRCRGRARRGGVRHVQEGQAARESDRACRGRAPQPQAGRAGLRRAASIRSKNWNCPRAAFPMHPCAPSWNITASRR